jgi:hypothetical protein
LYGKRLSQNLPKIGRTIHREHRQQESNEDEGNINVVSHEIISFHHTGFKYLILPSSSLLSCCRCSQRIERPFFGKIRPTDSSQMDLEITVQFLVKNRVRIHVLKFILKYFQNWAHFGQLF